MLPPPPRLKNRKALRPLLEPREPEAAAVVVDGVGVMLVESEAVGVAAGFEAAVELRIVSVDELMSNFGMINSRIKCHMYTVFQISLKIV